jgi:putative alpha-1,2-mannosidase
MGFYPVCPGTDEYVFGSPLFDRITLKMEDGREMIFEAPGNSDENIYADEILLNGKKHNKNFITHADLQKGGKITYRMSNTPNKSRGTKPGSYPFSVSK